MGLFSRFFGKKTEAKQMDSSIVPNPDIDSAASLSIVFKGELNIDNDKLLTKLKSIDPTIKDIRIGNDIKEGRLSPILSNYEIEDLNIYAIYPSRKLLPLRTRCLIDFLIIELKNLQW